jgi:hypothetical protein
MGLYMLRRRRESMRERGQGCNLTTGFDIKRKKCQRDMWFIGEPIIIWLDCSPKCPYNEQRAI